jgi:hypothetical protein
LAIAILFGGAFLGIAGAAVVVQSYGVWLVLAGVGFGTLAAVKTIVGHYRAPSVHLIADETQSLWGQSRQPDGRTTTQLSFQAQATNLTDNFIKLSAVRISRPWTRARVLTKMLATRHPDYPRVNMFSREYSIAPGAVSYVTGTLILEGAIGRAGKPMNAVLRISDQFGRWHKMKLKLVSLR